MRLDRRRSPLRSSWGTVRMALVALVLTATTATAQDDDPPTTAPGLDDLQKQLAELSAQVASS